MCRIVDFDGDTYLANFVPVPSPSDTLKVKVDFEVLYIDEIDEPKLSFSVNLNTAFTWLEHRIDFKNLKVI